MLKQYKFSRDNTIVFFVCLATALCALGYGAMPITIVYGVFAFICFWGIAKKR